MTPDYLADDEFDYDREAPGLSKLKKENPFTVPVDYFETLAGNIQNKINALPDLERMNKENPFRVPDGYFDSLPTTIQQRITDEKRKRNIFGEWISFVLRPKYALAFATIIILVVLGIKYLVKPAVIDTPDNYLSCDEVKNSSCICDMDESIFVDALEQEQNKNTNIKEDNSFEDYLIDNNIDISQLENSL